MSNSSPNTSGVRSKLEFPVWYRGFARSYIAWANAPSDLKTPLLLQGPALAQAENWLLTHPDKLSESQKRFIVRSIGLRAKGPSAPQPEAQVVRRSGGRWRRSSDRSLWHLYAVIAVGLWVFSPDLLRDLMVRSLNRPEAYEELRRRRLSPSAPPPTTVADTDVPSSQAPAPAAPGKDAATVAKAPLGDIDETPPLTFPIATADTRAVRLTALAREKQEAGQSRTALLLGIEATVEAIEEEPDGGKKTVAAAGLLMRTMATRETLGTLVHRSAIARTRGGTSARTVAAKDLSGRMRAAGAG